MSLLNLLIVLVITFNLATLLPIIFTSTRKLSRFTKQEQRQSLLKKTRHKKTLDSWCTFTTYILYTSTQISSIMTVIVFMDKTLFS